MDKVMHFEIPADNVERALGFYEKAFGWEVQKIPGMDYNIVHTVEIDKENMPKEIGAINGGLMKRQGEIKNIVITIGVKDIKKSIEKVMKAGGELVQDKQEISGMGYSAYVKDSEGNIIGLWENIRK